jgi:hypothetical protein
MLTRLSHFRASARPKSLRISPGYRKVFTTKPALRASHYAVPAAGNAVIRGGDIASYRPVKLDDAIGDMRRQVTKELLRLKESLAAGQEAQLARAKAAIAKHVGKLVLTPSQVEGRPVYKVAGAVTVGGVAENCRMQMVARDGIEPPTPAFSGLRSTS